MTENNNDASMMEAVLLQGDLSKLTPAERVQYYLKVCESVHLNPLTRPFEYIWLKKKVKEQWIDVLTLYAKKDATDQLRNLHGVSIDDVDIKETDTAFIVKIKGHNKGGRTDVEIGVVAKTDMKGNLENVQMKAVTKGKRRLALSLCGLGWLDESEIETIPSARLLDATTAASLDVLDEVAANIESPIDKGIRLYMDLLPRAQKVGVSLDLIPEHVTIDELREMYRETLGNIEDAEQQAEEA